MLSSPSFICTLWMSSEVTGLENETPQKEYENDLKRCQKILWVWGGGAGGGISAHGTLPRPPDCDSKWTTSWVDVEINGPGLKWEAHPSWTPWGHLLLVNGPLNAWTHGCLLVTWVSSMLWLWVPLCYFLAVWSGASCLTSLSFLACNM